MATTKNAMTGINGTKKDFPFTFPYLKTTDLKVELFDASGGRLELDSTKFTFANATTVSLSSGSATDWQETTGAPKSDVTGNVYRETSSDALSATFYPGSALRSSDLNDNYTQNLYSTQEIKNDATDALDNSRVLVDGAYKSAITRATESEAKADAADAIADDAADDVKRWIKDGDGSDTAGNEDDADFTQRPLKPQGVPYAVAQVAIANTTAGNAVTTAGNAVTTAGNAVTTAGNAVTTANAALQRDGSNTMTGNIVFEGATDDAHETTLAITDPTADRTITLPNVTGTVVTTGDTGTVTAAMLDAAAVVTNAEHSGASVNDTSFFTTSAADARYFNVSTGDTIKDGDAFPDNDTTIATTAAINDRIIDLVDDVGGFVPLVSEATFPAANPDVNNGAGTVVSIGVLGASYTPSSGTCTIPDSTLTNISGSNVTITDCGTTVLSAGYGCLVETTSTLHTYKFHRLTPKATEVTTVAGNTTNITTVAGNDANITTVAGNATNINTVAGNNSNITAVAGKITDVETVSDNITDVSNFADLYQIATSAPGTDGGGNALAAGDLWYDSSSNKTLKVHTGSAFSAVSPSQSVLDDISIVSGNLTRLEDLGSIADAISSGSGTGSLDTCATNITNINAFANTYFIASSAPTGGTVGAGDLWYDSTGNILKYYNGSAWGVTAGAGLSEISEDTTPELGGHLDCNDKNLTEVATVSGNNLQIDFGSLT